MFKKSIAFLLILMMVAALLAGCGGGQTEEPAPNENALKVGLIVAGGFGDRSFYDSALEGVTRAENELGIIKSTYECKQDASLYNDLMVEASQNNDIVVVNGFQFYDLVQEIAPQFPDVKYIYIDDALQGPENLTSIDYLENEGAFLAGALAAMVTTYTDKEGINPEKKIGAVGGMDIPVIRNFMVGYEQGAKYIDPEVKVLINYAGDFEDPAKGKENALDLYGKGADVVFQVAGKTGEGVFQAAKEVGAYAIGVDGDQSYIAPDVIISSMLKQVGLSIYESIQKIQEGTFEMGTVIRYGLNENGVGLTYNDNMKRHVPEEFITKLQEIEEKIRSGEIVVEEAQ